MLSFVDGDRRNRRRAFLRVGGLTLGGLTLPELLAAGADAKPLLKDRSVIFLFLHGGPSQTETFDPKMSAPEGIRSATGELQTSIPGVTFGGTFPKLARLADRLAVVRSFATGDGNHDIKPIVGRHSFEANIGTLYARVAGNNHPRTGVPSNVLLVPRSVDPNTQPAIQQFGKFHSSGDFGAGFAPFDPSGGAHAVRDMRLSVSMDRLDDRRVLLRQLDQARFRLTEPTSLGEMDRVRRQALDIVIGGVAGAFDLRNENPRIVERYDTAPLVRPENINRKWKNYNHYVDNAKTLGKLLLLARRLCERGCGFVTVTTNFVWDMHADENNATMTEGMSYMAPPLDHALSAFMEDVHARGLQDKILLVACGEMGRTPKINKNGGRDHWGVLAPLLLFGGGLKMGQVIGRSAKDAGSPASEPIGIQNLLATILHTLFDVGELRLVAGAPREITNTMTAWKPIRELVG